MATTAVPEVKGLGMEVELALEFVRVVEEAAIESAKQFIDGHDIELWQRDRFVFKFKRREMD